MKGTLYVLASAVLFSLNTLIVKQLTPGISSFSVSMIRFVTGTAAGLILLRSLGIPFRIRSGKLWCFRGFLGSIAMILYFLAIEMNGIAWATLLVNTSSFFIAVNGRLFFGQPLQKKTMAGMLLAFSGVLVIFYSSPDISVFGTIVGLGVAFLRGFTAHLIKKTSQINHPVIVYMGATIFGLIYLPAAWPDIRIQSSAVLLTAVLAGLVVFAAQVIFTAGLKRISPDRSSLLLYTTIPMSMVMGFFLGEDLSSRFFTGSFLIVSGILLELLVKSDSLHKLFHGKRTES